MSMNANPLSFFYSPYPPPPPPPVYYIDGKRTELDDICRDFCMKVCRVQYEAKKHSNDPESRSYDAVEISNDVVGYMDITSSMIDRKSDDRHLFVSVTKDEVLRYAESFEDNPVLGRLGYDIVTFYMLNQKKEGRIPLRRVGDKTVDELRFYLMKKADVPRNAEADV